MKPSVLYSLVVILAVVAVTQWHAGVREAEAMRANPPASDFVEVDDVPVHYQIKGEGPDLVLLHGASGNLNDFTMGFTDRLTDRYRVILFDRPGLGWTGRLPGYGGAWNNAEETPLEPISLYGRTKCEAEHVLLDSPNAVALRLAIERPELVRSLTVFEPVFFHIASLDAPDSLREHDAIAGPFFEAIESGDLETGARLFNRMWSEPGRLKWDEMPEQMRAAMIRAIPVVPDTDGFLYRDDQNMLPRLGALRVPTLVLHGALSLGIIGATCSGLVSRIPGAREHVFAETGHMGPISNPREVARVWGEFLNSS